MKTLFTNLILISLLAVGCSKKSSIPADHNSEALSANEEFFLHPEEVTLYNSYQPNAENIKKCAFQTTDKNSCKIQESPLLGMSINDITVSDVLNRTMASRASYLETFKNILRTMPQESLKMFGSVNAIVISERIVPSFYHYGSGAIYLSSSYFWKTPEEKALIKKKDYREDFGNTLQYSLTSDYVKNGKSVYRNVSKTYRTEADLAPVLARLLFHELAHANDFFPRSLYSSKDLDASKSYYDVTNDRWDHELIISQNMKTKLTSEVLNNAGQILYQGKTITQADLEVKAHTIVDEFRNDGASDFYAYSTSAEDLAMLIEQSLFYHYYNFSAYILVIKYPTANFTIPEDYEYPIAGGIKNKIADPKVKERAQHALEKIFDVGYSQKITTTLDQIKSVDIPEDTSWEAIGRY